MDTIDTEYYRRLADFAVDIGELMLRSGAETHRVEDTMSRILATAGFSVYSAFVLPTGVMLTLSEPKVCSISITKRTLDGGKNMSRVCEANEISRDFCSAKIDLDEAEKRLAAIAKEVLYPMWLKIVGTMFACAGMAVAFGGGMLDFGAGFVCGFFLALVNYFLRSLIGKDIIADTLCALTVTIAAIAIAFIFQSYLPRIGTLLTSAVISGCIMPLVPGVAITNAIRDMLCGDYLSAASRAIEASLAAASIAIGVGAGIFLGSKLDLTSGINFSSGELNFLQCIFVFISMLGFGIVFAIPKKHIVPCAANAMICWAIYVALKLYTNAGIFWANFIPILAVDLIAQILARILKAPVTSFLLGGILPLVPGFLIYRTAHLLILRDSGASAALSQTLLIAGSIALAIFLMDTLVSMYFRAVAAIKEKKRIKRKQ